MEILPTSPPVNVQSMLRPLLGRQSPQEGAPQGCLGQAVRGSAGRGSPAPPRSRATWVVNSPPSMSRTALRVWESVNVWRRPLRSLPVARQLATESVIRSRVTSSSIGTRAAMTGRNIDPRGERVYVYPARVRCPRSCPLPHGASAKVGSTRFSSGSSVNAWIRVTVVQPRVPFSQSARHLSGDGDTSATTYCGRLQQVSRHRPDDVNCHRK